MDSVLQSISDWIMDLLVSGVMFNLTAIFDGVNMQVDQVATDIGMSPVDFQPAIFNLIKNLSENVITPIAGLILTFIACYELIQLVIGHNNLANFETWIFFKWVFKTFIGVVLISNTMDICMAVFDVAQYVVNQSAGVISGTTDIDVSTLLTMQSTLESMNIAELIGIFFQTSIIYVLMALLSILIFVIVYARMIEIYLTVSLAPIPFATFANKEQSMIGQNYLRSLFALGFQGFLIMVSIVGQYEWKQVSKHLYS